jgi:tetratricopeptide (TPR) repeat protein
MATAGDPLTRFRAELRQLHAAVGRPSLEDLRCHAERIGRSLPTSTAHDLLVGSRVARWSTVETFLLACHRHARQRRIALGAAELDLAGWQACYKLAATAPARPGAGSTTGRADGTHPPTQVPAQLPAALVTFTGRAAELLRLDAELSRTPSPGSTMTTLLISGTAGVGKTSLAVEWAHRVRARFPDGQLYVNLRGYDPDRPTPAADATAGFLRALGTPAADLPLDPDDRAAAYRTALDGRRVLVVLDNASSLEQVQPLLPGAPTCAVIVTSRDGLPGLVVRHGARRLDLDLMPGGDALDLLRTLVGDRVDADPEAAAALAARCARLPLALCLAGELAASRPNDPIATLVEGLADHRRRLDLLDAGGDPRTAVRRVFSWSYRHLPPAAARAFRLLGLHPGPDLDPYAAAALIDSDLLQAHRLLDQLTRAHLIQPTGTDRYGMHDLLRDYAIQAADNHHSERGDGLSRLFAYYQAATTAAVDVLHPSERDRRPRPLAVATPIPPMDAGSARSWLDAERKVLVRACAHTATAGWPEHAVRLATALKREVEDRPADAVVVYTHALDAADQLGDRSARAYALIGLGWAHQKTADYDRAFEHNTSAAIAFRQLGDDDGLAHAEHNLGAIYLRRGQVPAAVDHFRRSFSGFRKTGARAGEAHAVKHLGLALTELGHHDEAVDRLTEALELHRSIGNAVGAASTLENLAGACLAGGRYEEAERYVGQALALCAEIEQPWVRADALDHLGALQAHHGDFRLAVETLRTALAEHRALHDRWGESWSRNVLGETLHAAGDHEQARAEHTTALAIATAIGGRLAQRRAHTGLAACYRATGDPEQAAEHERLAGQAATGSPPADPALSPGADRPSASAGRRTR